MSDERPLIVGKFVTIVGIVPKLGRNSHCLEYCSGIYFNGMTTFMDH